MSDVCHIDLESRSAADLKKVGLYVYAVDPTTSIWCAAWAMNDDPVQLWLPNQPCPPVLRRHVERGGEVCSWNISFERIMWRAILERRHGWPRLPLTQVRCIMAEALAMSLPGSLEHAAPAVGLEIAKDGAGKRLMLQLARPRKAYPDGRLEWWDDEDRLQRLYAYNKQDVEVERALEKRLLRLSPQERKVFLLDAKCNDRGISVDLDLCRQALKIVEAATEELDAAMHKTTQGEVGRCSNAQQLCIWLKSRGVDTSSVNKETVLDLLELDDLPPDVERALKLRQEAAKASTAKIGALIQRTNSDGRMRGNVQYHGASTGRWAGRGAQLQNLPRASYKIEEEDLALIRSGSLARVKMFRDKPLTLISNAIRSMLIAGVSRA